MNRFQYAYYSIILFFMKLAVYMGLYTPPAKTKGYMDHDMEYITPLKSQFLKIFDVENSAIEFNTNVDTVFYDKDKFKTAMTNPENRFEKQWRTRILFEKTPRGNIIMYYDAYKMGFSYYCDQNVVSYDILNAAAMKYVRFYRCLDFFMDENHYSSPLIKYHCLDDEKTAKTSKGPKKDLPFAKLRNYSLINETKGEPPAVEKMKNKFIYLGKFRNFQIIQPQQKKRKVLTKFKSPLLDSIQPVSTEPVSTDSNDKPISYRDFKKQYLQKQI